MTRTLRPRKSRPSYAALEGIDLEGEISGPTPGPSKTAVAFEEDVDSESDFSPEKDPIAQEEEVEDEEDEDMEPDVDDDNGPDFDQPISRSVSRRSTSALDIKPKVVKSTLSRASKRQMYVLPAPSVHHRHRAVPLYTRMGRVERLESRPSLFKKPKITMSNNFTQNSKVTDRVNKSWGYNVGSGPLWEMAEDRGWYKEAVENVSDMDNDARRRPKVYGNIKVKAGWEVLNKKDAAPYLPTDVVLTAEGDLKPPPAVPCLLGPFGKQTQMNIEMFQSHNMSEFLTESPAHIFNAGAPVWGLDWCPIHSDDRAYRYTAHSYKQYLAVAPFPTSSHSPEIGVRVARTIWSLGPAQPPTRSSKEVDRGEVKCELVLCLEGGPAHELKWCPLPSHDDFASPNRPRKLGLLSGVFEDGSWPANQDPSEPVYVKLPEPLLRIELEETNCWTFDWANSELIAIGTTNGIIAVYDIGPHLKAIDSPTMTNVPPRNRLTSNHGYPPTHYITVHQSAIRALAWIRAPPATSTGAPRTDGDPTVIASGGYDGMECMTDIREGHGSVMNRTRDVINAMAFSPFGGGPVTIDHENIVKAYSASPSMLGRGHTLLEPQGPVWSVNASDFHPQLAVGSADGSCTTTNSLRSTRRGGSVPFFIHKIYQLDYSRKSGVYRMLDRFLPQATKEKAPEKERIKANAAGTGAWPREVGVHRVTWNSCNGLAASGLLASATASGLCRVDELWGRWIKGKVPYGGIEHIRRELDDEAMDVDGDTDESAGSS
ncbi:hypothetical protein FPV67DRAFT_1558547 [Lyophyllum atratum]|nr:hypothetical protein FPV67DRAFT_1558547 [Lyophyllum atratum]